MSGLNADSPVSVVFFQNHEAIYTWETSLSSVSLLNLDEAVMVTGLADEDISIEYHVFDDSEETFETEGIVIQSDSFDDHRVIASGIIRPYHSYW